MKKLTLPRDMGVMDRWHFVAGEMKSGKRYKVTGYDGTSTTGRYTGHGFDDDDEAADIFFEDFESDDYITEGFDGFVWPTTLVATIEEI